MMYLNNINQITEMADMEWDKGHYNKKCKCGFMNRIYMAASGEKTVNDYCRACGIPVTYRMKGVLI